MVGLPTTTSLAAAGDGGSRWMRRRERRSRIPRSESPPVSADLEALKAELRQSRREGSDGRESPSGEEAQGGDASPKDAEVGERGSRRAVALDRLESTSHRVPSDDGDDNLVLGLAVDKISLYEKIKIQRNLEFIELSPRCILLCLTCDGKLTLYHVAWVSEPPDLPKVASSQGDNIANAGLCNGSSVESDLCVTTSRLKDELNCSPHISNISAGDKIGNHGTLDVVEPCSRPGPGIITSSYSRGPAIEEPNALSKTGDLGTNSTMYERASDSLAVEGSATGSSSILNSSSVAASAKLPGSRKQLLLANSASSKPRHILESEAQFSKQFYNVKEVTKELDDLLSSIEGEGGFKDLCTVFQEQSLLALEASLDVLSEVSFIYRNKVENQLMEIQLLHNKMLEGNSRVLHDSFVRMMNNVLKIGPDIEPAKEKFDSHHARIFATLRTGRLLETRAVFRVAGLTARFLVSSPVRGWCGFKGLIGPPSLLVHGRTGSTGRSLSARQVYVECIVQQASDHKYWDIWNSQKLSHEFEAKRLRISDLMQNLTNQLIELKRNFNSLEINRFGEYDTKPTGWRAPSHSRAPSRCMKTMVSLESLLLWVFEILPTQLIRRGVLLITAPVPGVATSIWVVY
ncbi:hypothetical protein KSP40_PGU009747 [Platanthera guangdongensis]|uniref:Uncharacterized protein n=1 Tax=Platanthera guangdongensis TaxID=2320717 RepID=A0ABR2LVK0_9ASPA